MVQSLDVQSQASAFVLRDVAMDMVDAQVVQYAASMDVDTHVLSQVIINFKGTVSLESFQKFMSEKHPY